LSTSFREEYAKIATDDLSKSMQNENYLREKALADLRNIGTVSNLSILEVGPGYGHLAQELIRKGAKVTLVDLVPQYMNQLTKKFDIPSIQADIQHLGIRNSFDLIILCDVLEHVLRPSDVLYWVSLALRERGSIYIRVPSYEANLAYSVNIGAQYQLGHLRTFTEDLLKRELLSIGFANVKRTRYLKKSVRVPRNFLPGIEKYWLLKRIYLSKDLPERNLTMFSHYLARFYDGFSGENWRIFKRVLNLLRLPLTKPGEIFITARKI
jgi:SAM-dependent methyltransferase